MPGSIFSRNEPGVFIEAQLEAVVFGDDGESGLQDFLLADESRAGGDIQIAKRDAFVVDLDVPLAVAPRAVVAVLVGRDQEDVGALSGHEW